ncbi:MAG TPA: hypothetical protein QGF58_30505 [Myxococcota bacterium]|nr:hypothetical protein [Myxococcota bacterium]
MSDPKTALDEALALEQGGEHAAAQEKALRALLELREREGDREGRLEVRHQLAQVLLLRERPDAALSEVHAGLELCDRASDESERAALLVLAAQINLVQDKPARALALAKQSLGLARRGGKRRVLIDALVQYALMDEDGQRARSMLEEALDGAELLRELPLRARILQQLAGIEAGLGDVTSALGRLRYCAETWVELGDAAEQLEALHAAGELASAHGLHAEAIDLGLLQQRIAAAEPSALGAACFVTAQRRIAAGDLEGAAADFRGAVDAYPMPSAKGVARAMLGQVLAATGDVAEARAMLERAREDLVGTDGAAEIDQLLSAL